jgi:hypothetical protein
MSRPANPDRPHAITHIRLLVKKHGHKHGAKLAREQYKHIAAPTWHRWVNEAIGDARFDAGRVAAENLAAEVVKNVPNPTAIVPGLVIEHPATARRAIDFWKLLDGLEADAELLRNFATTLDQDGKRKVKIPRVLVDSAKLRSDLVRLALQYSSEVYGFDKMQQFNDAILAEIDQESPELTRRILARLRRLNGELGIATTSAG